jgi:hypothetical protein
MEKVKISKQARELLNLMPDVDEEKLQEWYTKNKMGIGTQHVLEFALRVNQRK